MSSIRLSGTSSGYYDLTVPAVAGTNSIDLSNLPVKDSSGRLGIGTSSPTSKLHIVDGAGANIAIQSTAGSHWRLGDAVGSTNGYFVIYDYTNSGKRLEINNSGHVTTPNQPMVRMSLGSHFGINNVHPSAPGAQITGFTVHENVGSHWNNSNSNFTCPVAGVYCVSAFWIKYPAAGAAHVDLHKNGSAFDGIRWRGHEGGSSYHQAGGTVFVTCAANDILDWHYFGAPGIHSGNGHWGIRLVG